MPPHSQMPPPQTLGLLRSCGGYLPARPVRPYCSTRARFAAIQGCYYYVLLPRPQLQHQLALVLSISISTSTSTSTSTRTKN